MEILIKETIKMENQKDLEFIHGLMDVYMLETSRMD
jgi:hypothetical protein